MCFVQFQSRWFTLKTPSNWCNWTALTLSFRPLKKMETVFRQWARPLLAVNTAWHPCLTEWIKHWMLCDRMLFHSYSGAWLVWWSFFEAIGRPWSQRLSSFVSAQVEPSLEKWHGVEGRLFDSSGNVGGRILHEVGIVFLKDYAYVLEGQKQSKMR